VSHDRRLLETICERLWVVDDGLAVPFDDGYRAWRAAVGEGWTVKTEAARRANRGKAPAAGRTRSRAPEPVETAAAPSPSGAVAVATPRPKVRQKLSKEAYRRRREALDGELSRLGLRRSQLELAVGTPAVAANFVEMRRVTSELADVERALAEAEDAWLELEEQAP
jgi:ATP-binding cassette subfamily F protein 3